MQHSNPMPDSTLEAWFALLRAIPTRDQRAAERGKEIFMAQVRTLPKPVSNTTPVRHIGWIKSIQQLINNKEYSPMYATITSIVLVISLILGGTGATVYAAQDSLPNQALYRVKTLSEDLALGLSMQNQEKLQLELEYADRRVNEMISLTKVGLQPPESVLLRLERHLDQALKLTIKNGEEELLDTLLQVRTRLQQQIRALDQATQNEPLLIRTREAIQARLHWVALGLSEPNAFRAQVQVRNQFQQQPEFGEEQGPGFSPGPGHQPYDSGFSPGPGPKPARETGESDPGSGPGPESDRIPSENGNSPGPESGSKPEEYRPGPGPASDQKQDDDNPGPGPNPDQEVGTKSREQGSDPECCSNPENGLNGGENGSRSSKEQGESSQKGSGGKP